MRERPVSCAYVSLPFGGAAATRFAWNRLLPSSGGETLWPLRKMLGSMMFSLRRWKLSLPTFRWSCHETWGSVALREGTERPCPHAPSGEFTPDSSRSPVGSGVLHPPQLACLRLEKYVECVHEVSLTPVSVSPASDFLVHRRTDFLLQLNSLPWRSPTQSPKCNGRRLLSCRVAKKNPRPRLFLREAEAR